MDTKFDSPYYKIREESGGILKFTKIFIFLLLIVLIVPGIVWSRTLNFFYILEDDISIYNKLRSIQILTPEQDTPENRALIREANPGYFLPDGRSKFMHKGTIVNIPFVFVKSAYERKSIDILQNGRVITKLNNPAIDKDIFTKIQNEPQQVSAPPANIKKPVAAIVKPKIKLLGINFGFQFLFQSIEGTLLGNNTQGDILSHPGIGLDIGYKEYKVLKNFQPGVNLQLKKLTYSAPKDKVLSSDSLTFISGNLFIDREFTKNNSIVAGVGAGLESIPFYRVQDALTTELKKASFLNASVHLGHQVVTFDNFEFKYNILLKYFFKKDVDMFKFNSGTAYRLGLEIGKNISLEKKYSLELFYQNTNLKTNLIKYNIDETGLNFKMETGIFR